MKVGTVTIMAILEYAKSVVGLSDKGSSKEQNRINVLQCCIAPDGVFRNKFGRFLAF